MTVRRVIRLAVAVLVSALVPTVLYGPKVDSLAVLPVVFLAALGLAISLGLPFFFVFKRYGRASAVSAVLVGFVVGGVIGGFLHWPEATLDTDYNAYSKSNPSTRDRPTIEGLSHVPISNRWTFYFESLALFGVLGAAGGFAFWYVAEASPSSTDQNNDDTSGA